MKLILSWLRAFGFLVLGFGSQLFAKGDYSIAEVSINIDLASSQTFDGGDALGTLSIIMMMLLTLMVGLYFVRTEEKREE